jgi:3-oxoacyl-[acyl-carrier protein] reductase
MDLGIAGKRAAVAAASGGLGLASAQALAAEGVHVAICGRDQARIEAAATEIGHGCIPLVCDVGDAEGGAAFVEAATAALGGIDILVANGGGPPAGNFASTPIERYAAAIDLSLLSVVGMCTAAVPGMQANGWGRIVANTARAGVTGFLKTLAREVAGAGITVNTVQPGLHATDRVTALYGAMPDAKALGIPSGTIGQPADFGAIVAFLCSSQAGYTTGLQYHVDGGNYAALL